MCGRYTLRTNLKLLQQTFGFDSIPDVRPRYNIAPTQDVLAVRQTDGERSASFLRWGLIPSWAQEANIGRRMFNARGDTVASKPTSLRYFG